MSSQDSRRGGSIEPQQSVSPEPSLRQGRDTGPDADPAALSAARPSLSEPGGALVDTLGFEVLFHASPMGIGFSVDRELREVNDRLCAMTGYAREELIGQSLRMLHPSAAAFEAIGETVYPRLCEEPVVRVDAQLKRKDGHILDVALCLALVDPKEPARGVIATVLDITRRKVAEQAVAELNRTLEARVAERTAEVQRQATQLRALATELTQTEQRERKRLATILHDHIQQLIVAAQIQTGQLARTAGTEALRAAAQAVGETLAEALAASRSLTVELSPPVLQERGLVTAPGLGASVTLFVPGGDRLPAAADLQASASRTGAGAYAVHQQAPRWRVLIVDDHRIVREGIAGLLRVEADIEVAGEAETGAQALALAAELKPDVIIMDINLGTGMDGIEATRRVLAAAPKITVIGLSMHVDRDVADAMLAAGAAAYLTKGGPPEDLISAIRTHAGGRGP
ncbi:response regulator [Thiohalocapsa halophila]|nr:response regulator [Thiohalocapsa halophila]